MAVIPSPEPISFWSPIWSIVVYLGNDMKRRTLFLTHLPPLTYDPPQYGICMDCCPVEAPIPAVCEIKRNGRTACCDSSTWLPRDIFAVRLASLDSIRQYQERMDRAYEALNQKKL